MKTRFIIGIAALVMMAVTALGGNPTGTVSRLTAKQRYPWNGLVDISFTLSGTEEAYGFAVVATNSTTGAEIPVRTLRDKAGGAIGSLTKFNRGDVTIMWDADIDAPNVNIETLSLSIVSAPPPSSPPPSGGVQLWEYGPYWADRNVGASTSWDKGEHFWNSQVWQMIDGQQGMIDGQWRLPTASEWRKLMDNCSLSGTDGGIVVRGKGGASGASIFLRAANAYVHVTSYGQPDEWAWDHPFGGAYWSGTTGSEFGHRTFYSFSFEISNVNGRIISVGVGDGDGSLGSTIPLYYDCRRSIRAVQDYTGSAPIRSDTTTLSLDTREIPLVMDSVNVTWDSSWIGGNNGKTIVICDNGAEIMRTTGKGEFTHTPSGLGLHELIYITYNRDGVANEEMYRAVVNKAGLVFFDANGGEVEPKSKQFTLDAAYGQLPVPVFEWHAFRGWLQDGNAVSEETIVATASNHTLVAEWDIGIGGGVWEYPEGNGPITLDAPTTAPSGDMVIPDEIDGRPIAAITDEAFAGNTAITSLTIPNSVTSIGEHAFDGCDNLSTLIVPYHLHDAVFRMNLPESCAVYFRLRFGDLDVGAGMDWRISDGAEWYALEGDGRSFIRSGAIPANGASSVETTLRGPGTLTFDWRVSANRGDYCRFRLDGVELESITRSTQWETVEVQIPEGVHIAKWTYERGSGAAAGEDAAFLDNVDWRPEVSLALSSDHGAPTPASGAHTYLYGDEVAASVTEPVASNGIRYVCTGWTGSGSVPASGSGTSTSFTITNDSSLVWNWRTDYRTQISVTGGTAAFTSPWIADGEAVSVALSPSTHLYEISLSGDTEGVTLDGKTLRFTADRPRSIGVTISEVKVSLAVESEWGVPSPANGVYARSWGDAVTASVREPDPVDGVQYRCTGWTGTGSVPASGTATSVSFRIEEDSSIRWNWRTNVWLSLSVLGPVAADFAEGWIEKGRTAVAHWTPSVPYYTIELLGDTDGIVLDEEARTLEIPADRPRNIRLALSGLTLADALDAPGILWATDGVAPWFPQVAESADGEDAAQSGGVIGAEASGLEATLTGPGTFSWEWRIDSSGNSGVDVFLDGDWLDSLAPSEEWSRESLEIAGEGGHVVRFEYWNAGSASASGDRAWLDRVSWTGERRHYMVKFDANGGEGAMADQIAYVGGRAALSANAFTRQGWIFAGWATSASGAAVFADGENVTDIAAEGATITLYAVWSAWGPGTQYTIHFSANGGEGLMADQTAHVGRGTALTANAFTRQGCFFVGWALEPTGDAALLDGDSTLELDAEERYTVTLYAVWHEGMVSGLSVKYYDISSSGYSTWTQSEAAMMNFFAALTPTLEGNTHDWTIGLSSGNVQSAPSSSEIQRMVNVGMTSLEFNAESSRFHGKYSNASQSNFSVLFQGTLRIDTAGSYGFACMADDQIVIYIDGSRVCNTTWANYATGSLNLEKGRHRIAIAYRQNSGGHGFSVQWKKPGDTSYSPLPQSVLSYGTTPYAVRFDANGGEGAMPKRVYATGDDVTLPANAFIRGNRFFAGWATEKDGPVVFADGETIEDGFDAASGETVTLYAVWADSRILFNANDGEVEGDMAPFYLFAGTEQTLPRGAFTKDGHFILGWALTPDGDATLLDGGSTEGIIAEEGETVSLYAVWHEVTRGGNGLSVKYYDISSSGYSTWTQSEAAMTNYFVSRPPTIVTNSLAFGETLQSGFQRDLRTYSLYSEYTGLWLDGCSTNRYHGKYANKSQNNFAMLYEGYIMVVVGGEYTFGAACDDYIVIYIDGTRVCARSGYDPTKGTISLSDGQHRITIATYEDQSEQGMFVEWKKPGDTSFAPLPQSVLSHAVPMSVSTYAIRFNANGGKGTMPKRVYVAGDNVTLPALGFVRDGWTFVGWATEPDGPVAYADGETIGGGLDAANGETVTLYARWAQSQYFVHFNANGGEEEMADEAFWIGIPDRLPFNAFARTGYAFAGWATSASGEVVYPDGESIMDIAAAGAMVTLYARWTVNTFSVTFDQQGGTGSAASVAAILGRAMPAISMPTRTGYSFGGYWTGPDGSGIQYYTASGASARNWDIASATTLYANWTANTYTVTLNRQSGSGGTASVTATYGSAMPSISVPTRTGYTFGGYYTAANGGGTQYYTAAGASARSWDKTSVTTLYAKWTANTYAVTLNRQGGSGGTASVIATYGDAMPAITVPTRAGYTFGGYYSDDWTQYYTASGASARYWDKATATTLYARWDKLPWFYSINNGKVTILEYGATAADIAIPSSFEGYPVTAIGHRAFYDNSGLTSVIIPNSVTSIGSEAFYSCDGLTSVTIPNSVTSIGDGAFHQCYNLKSVTIPNSVKSIGDGAFYDCDGLTSVTIPNSVTSIGNGAFQYCGGLTSVMIGNGVTSIGNAAFQGCVGLTSVTIGNGVKSIGDSAFYWCSRLTSVTIPDSVMSIGPYAFFDCSGLTSVTIPDSVKSIGDSAFCGCNGLKSVSIGKGVTSIGFGAFAGCSGLTSLTIPPGVTSIETYAFLDCSGLKTIRLPDRFKDEPGDMGIPSGCQVVFYSTRYTVKFNANGGKLPKGKKMAAQTMTYGKAAKLRTNVFTRSGYVFIGWATKKGGAVKYKNAQSVKNLTAKGGTVTLYAVWAKKTYKVAFYANGGKGTMAVESFTYGKAKKLTANKFKRNGYVFKGWAKSKALAKKGKVAYKNKKKVKNLVTTGKTVKLYAVWKKR